MTSVVGQDHLDLLVAAGLAYGLITNPASRAFGGAGFFAAPSATDLGRILQQQNQASLEWLTRLGRLRLADRGQLRPYVHEPLGVDQIVPVEVLKACQVFEHACRSAPSWTASRARQYITALTAAAVRRLPGYVEASWLWTRPPTRSGPPIGYGAAWRPAIDGLLSVSEDQLVDQWPAARLVVVTADVVATVPALPSRSAVFVLTRREIPDETWSAVESLAPECVLFYPVVLPGRRDVAGRAAAAGDRRDEPGPAMIGGARAATRPDYAVASRSHRPQGHGRKRDGRVVPAPAPSPDAWAGNGLVAGARPGVTASQLSHLRRRLHLVLVTDHHREGEADVTNRVQSHRRHHGLGHPGAVAP